VYSIVGEREDTESALSAKTIDGLLPHTRPVPVFSFLNSLLRLEKETAAGEAGDLDEEKFCCSAV
jgi:hypothetical protein